METINHPEHYNIKGRRECIDEMLEIYGKEKVKAFCELNSFKYRYRKDLKGGEEDEAKARWYDETLKELNRGDLYVKDIEAWFKDRHLEHTEPAKQMLKLMEETGELAEALAKDRPNQIKDSIGDIFVVLVGLSLQLGFSIGDCVKLAYNEIKKRKGKVIKGVFIKEQDL